MRRSSPPHTGAWLMASSAGASTTATASLLCSVSFNDIISRVDIPNQESTSPRLTSWATAGGRLTCLPLCLGCLCLSSSCSLSGNNGSFWIIKKKYFQFRDPRQDTAKETAAAGANRRRDGFRKWIMEYLKKLLVTFFSPTMMILLLAGERNNRPLLSPNPP